MQVLGPDGTGSTEGILKAMDAVAEVVKKGKRADAPRQLLRVSRPSTTTSPFPRRDCRAFLRSGPVLPPFRCCRASRAQVPSSPRRLARSYLVRVMSRSLVEFFSCRRRRFVFYYKIRNRREASAASGLETLASTQLWAHEGQARSERHQSWFERVQQHLIVVLYESWIALVPASRARPFLPD